MKTTLVRPHRQHFPLRGQKLSILMVLVLQQLTVPAGQSVARLAEQLQRLLLVDVTEHGLRRGHADCL